VRKKFRVGNRYWKYPQGEWRSVYICENCKSGPHNRLKVVQHRETRFTLCFPCYQLGVMPRKG
jgi:hypothetical protein